MLEAWLCGQGGAVWGGVKVGVVSGWWAWSVGGGRGQWVVKHLQLPSSVNRNCAASSSAGVMNGT